MQRVQLVRVRWLLLGLAAAGLVVGFLALRGNGDSPRVGSSPITNPAPTLTDVKGQVEAAYLKAWDVWGQSLLSLDPSGLDAVLTGQALEVITGQVKAQRQKNQPVRIRVEHNYRIGVLNSTTVSIEDRYINHNVRLDPGTLEPVEKDPNRRERTGFTMTLVDGTWKIAEIIDYTAS